MQLLDLSMNGLKSISNAQILAKFKELSSLNVGGNNLQNIVELVDSLPASGIKALDLSDSNLFGSSKKASF